MPDLEGIVKEAKGKQSGEAQRLTAKLSEAEIQQLINETQAEYSEYLYLSTGDSEFPGEEKEDCLAYHLEFENPIGLVVYNTIDNNYALLAADPEPDL